MWIDCYSVATFARWRINFLFQSSARHTFVLNSILSRSIPSRLATPPCMQNAIKLHTVWKLIVAFSSVFWSYRFGGSGFCCSMPHSLPFHSLFNHECVHLLEMWYYSYVPICVHSIWIKKWFAIEPAALGPFASAVRTRVMIPWILHQSFPFHTLRSHRDDMNNLNKTKTKSKNEFPN